MITRAQAEEGLSRLNRQERRAYRDLPARELALILLLKVELDATLVG